MAATCHYIGNAWVWAWPPHAIIGSAQASAWLLHAIIGSALALAWPPHACHHRHGGWHQYVLFMDMVLWLSWIAGTWLLCFVLQVRNIIRSDKHAAKGMACRMHMAKALHAHCIKYMVDYRPRLDPHLMGFVYAKVKSWRCTIETLQYFPITCDI
jgi:hypothetical protein